MSKAKKTAICDPEKVVKEIQKKIVQKLTIDQKVKQKIFSKEHQKLIKYRKIQDQLQKINQQNLLWMNKIQQFNKMIENKKTSSIMKSSLQEQKNLLQNYHKLQIQLQKIKAVKKEIRNLQSVQWSEISTKNSQISHVLKQNKHQLLSLIKKPHSVPKNSLTQEKANPVIQKQEPKKVERKTKTIEELKQLGRKYLQFAKKAQKSKSQRRFLNLKNKNIDYGKEMKELIKLKVDDLSKKPDFEKQDTVQNRRKKTFKNTFNSTSTLTQRTNEKQQNSRSKTSFSKLFEKKKSLSLKQLN